MLTIVRRILAFWRPHRWLGAGLIATMLLKALFTVVLALSIKVIIDGVLADGPDTSPGSILVLLVVGFLVSASAGIANGYLAARAGAEILADVRLSLFDRLQELSIGFHRKSQTGDLLARFATDVAQLSNGVIRQPLVGMTSFAAVLFYVPVMMLLEPRLATPAVLMMPIVVYLVNRLAPDADQALDEEKRQIAAVLSSVSENLRAQPIVRAFGLQNRSRVAFGRRISTLRAASSRAEFRVQLLAVFSEYAVALVQISVVGAGAVLALRGKLEVGTLAAFVGLLVEFTWETTVIGRDVLPEIRKAWSGVRRVDELLSTGPVSAKGVGGMMVPGLEESIRFENVSFGYSPDDALQLRDVNLVIPGGAYVAIVGASGSGKSTLLSILLRFYDPSSGRTMIDSMDLMDVDPRELRRLMGTVFQETFLFNASLRENIRLSAPEAGDAEIDAAVEAAGLSELVELLPDGLETIVGESGRQLSGGQSQRVGLARAFLRRPQLLLLDEATSALDPATESEAVRAIEGLRSGRTVIMVTHRLETTVNADMIVVMREGTVDEVGDFEELIERGQTFARMWEKQQGFRVSRDGRAASVTADRLTAVPLLAGVPVAPLQRLAGEFVTVRFDKDAVVFEEGDPGERFYLIVRGVVEVSRMGEAGERVVAYLEDGDFFGEMALLEGAPRNATVTAVTPTTTLSIDREQFESMLADVPEIARTIRVEAADRARANGSQ